MNTPKDVPIIPVKLTTFEKIQMYLFDDPDKIPSFHKFTPQELEQKRRYAAVFSFWIEKPALSDKKIIDFMKNTLGLSKSQAYRDLHQVKVLMGNVRNATKEWQRYKLIAMLDKAYEFAERNRDAKTMIMAADKLGKYTQLDKEDAQKIPYDEIVPQPFELTTDVSVLGLKPIADLKEKQRRMREKYGAALIEEAELVDEQD